VASFKILFRNSPKTEKNHRKAQLGYPMSGPRDSKQVLPAYDLPLQPAWCQIIRPRVIQQNWLIRRLCNDNFEPSRLYSVELWDGYYNLQVQGT
jgi:hypothetical protein